MAIFCSCNKQFSLELLSDRIILICIVWSVLFSSSWSCNIGLLRLVFPLLESPQFETGHHWTNWAQAAVISLSQSLSAVIWRRFDSLWKTAKFSYVWSLMLSLGNKILSWSQIKSDFFARRVWPEFYSLAACWQINPCLTFICTNKYSE